MEIIYIKKSVLYLKKNPSDYLGINGLFYIWIADFTINRVIRRIGLYKWKNDSNAIIGFDD